MAVGRLGDGKHVSLLGSQLRPVVLHHTVLPVVGQLLVGVHRHQDGPRVRVDLVLLVPLLQVLVDPVPGDDDDEDDGVNGGEDEDEGDGDDNAMIDYSLVYV